MKLSIIIVNYNVRYFLHQCLDSVFRSKADFEFETLVVDNASADDSLEMVKKDFPQVKLIANTKNTGFSVANNQGIKASKGEYVLLLNPDTILHPETLAATVDFMENHKEAGALGIKMLDGTGDFLPESKRGLPTPWVAFYKIFGLSSLFKNSQKFGKYHLSYLSKDEVHEIDVLAGAFMLMRREALDQSGLLDETFFMYGEDIDLSYRIQLAGYKNYYFPDQPIIHYKGESTKRGSLNYVRVFYQAMQIFAKKHFHGSQGFLYSLAIYLAINLRAGLSIFKRVFDLFSLPILDAALLSLGMYWAKIYWENNHRYVEGGTYPDEFMQIAVPAYIAIWLISAFFSGGYDKPLRLWTLVRGLGMGSIILLAGYGLLPEDWRFSRALIALGSAWALLVLPLSRIILNKIPFLRFQLAGSNSTRSLIITQENRIENVQAIFQKVNYQPEFLGFVSQNEGGKNPQIIGDFNKLFPLIKAYQINELVYDAEALDYGRIIENMEDQSSLDLRVKIIPKNSDYLIGSDRADEAGNLYHSGANQLNTPSGRRSKRIFDLLIWPILFLSLPLQRNPSQAFKHTFQILLGSKTLVSTRIIPSGIKREGILNVKYSKDPDSVKINMEPLERDYLKHYSPGHDFKIWLKQWRNL